jgi:hypothetical protein
MAVDLGELKQLRAADLWKHEEHEFTPWLASEENIARLANALGLGELQIESVEVPVGPYFADILARDASENFIVIENQFGKTNHDHLGKLLTYAATLDATAVVWIAERFTDEHRKVIDWLNEHTVEDLSLFAVEVEVWQIDLSKPALRFSLVSQPNEIARQGIAIKAAGAMSPTRELQREFWTKFRERLLEAKVLPSAQAARPQYWFNISRGRANIHLSCIANTTEGRIGVRVYISNKVADSALPQLESQRHEIEAEVGEKLQWNPNPENIDKVILLDRPADLNDRDRWDEYVSWLVQRVIKLRTAFGSRVKALNFAQNENAEA